MSGASAILDALSGVASRLDDGTIGTDVQDAFLDENFYRVLGYEGVGHDVRCAFALPADRQPDYVTFGATETVTAVYEFVPLGRRLSSHEDRLFTYVDELNADYGVVTDGDELRLYRRANHTPLLTVSLRDATESDAATLEAALAPPEWDRTNPERVTDFLDRIDEVSVDGDLGRELFLDTFRLAEGSPFAALVSAMVDLLEALRDDRDAPVVTAAYDVWEASDASAPDDTPASWEPFVDDAESLCEFVFCLESSHALLARLLLAKAADDHDLAPAEAGFRRYFDALDESDGAIALDAYPAVAKGLIEEMRTHLVERLGDDVFSWWATGYGEPTFGHHETPFGRFRDGSEEATVSRVSPATSERFGRAVSRVIFAVSQFDFSGVESDLLGDLYQRNFDPETRTALGEFYTPQSVVDYVMDGVGYDVGVSEERIIDPACGSGAFLVEAVTRYLEDVRRHDDDPDWSTRLSELCTRPQIVGLDVHPFAVLMARVRFVMAIFPEYREAKRTDESFVIRRLPIFRTDSLRNERVPTGSDFDDDSPVRRLRMPTYDTARAAIGIRSAGEHFAALQGVLDVVTRHLREDTWEYRDGLDEAVHCHTTGEYDGVEDFFAPYVSAALGAVRPLRTESGDGRLFAPFEDAVLAPVVRDHVTYDYVVGNPPYVRKESIPPSYKKGTLEPLYPDVYSGNADLSVYFLKRGTELLDAGGTLGYVTSVKFTKSAYGDGIRRQVAENVRIAEFSNFELSNFFEDATAYPCVIVLKNEEPPDEYDIDVVYGKERPPDSEVRAVVTDIRDAMDESAERNETWYATYTTAFEDLDAREWRFTPKQSNDVFRKLDRRATVTLDEITDTISAGIKTGKNSVFVVTDDRADELGIEDELLEPIYRGSDVERYNVEQSDERIVYTEQIDIDDYPAAHSYLHEHRDSLENRSDAAFRGNEWFELNVPHSRDELEGEKILCRDMSRRSTFALDTDGRFVLDTVFYFRPTDRSIEPRYLVGLLNSALVDFYVKQTSPPLRNGYYRFKTRYLKPLPVRFHPDLESEIVSVVARIREQVARQNRIAAFPEPYLSDVDGDIGRLTYEWQSSRSPVEAAIQQVDDGRFAVTAGRLDAISDPLMDRGGRDERRSRARYVHAAVDGRRVTKGDVQTIPIPRSGDGVEALVEALADDRQHVAETNLDALDAEIDRLVYDLFELTDEERDVVEEFLDVF